jgi:hypothetical protein
MAISSWSAGIIRPVAVAPAGPYENGAAPGVWTLDEAAFWTKQGLWPIAGNSPPRAFFMGGSGSENTIGVVLISTTGNATDWGDLINKKDFLSVCSSATRAVISGFDTNSNVIDKLNLSSVGNSSDF